MGPIVRLVGSGLGLASEAIAAHKATKAQKYRAEALGPASSASQAHSPGFATTRSRDPSPNPAYSTLDASSSDYGLIEVADEEHARLLIEKGHAQPWDQPLEVGYENAEDHNDEAYWQLDEEAAALEGSPAYEEGEKPGQDTCDGSDSKNNEPKPDVHKLVRKFISAHPVSSRPRPSHPLPCPVIIPQRRPHSKSRGFVHAYAPVLEDCGIDQATFMAFLDTFQKASQASPVFEVIFLGGHVVGYAPTMTTTIISTITQVIAGAAIVVQSRHRTNTFLDEININFFRPRGLYALLMTYKPSRTKWSSAPTNISHSIVESADPQGLSHKFTNNLKFSAGKSHTELEMPEAAPLIFPTIDAAIDDQTPETAAKKENALKRGGKFISEYMDRRAQAEYNAENPNSSLAVPQGKPFASRYADPTHPANNGHLIGLVTGGNYDPGAQWKSRRPIGRLRKATGTDKPLKKIIRANVLYLMIVNMPNGEELAAARAEMEREKREKQENKSRGQHVLQDED